MSRRTRRPNPKRVVVGLDFGTHSTKCVVRPHGQEATLLRFGNPDAVAESYAWFTDPSLIRLVDGHMLFGRTAYSNTGGKLYRSLKMQLLSDLERGEDDECEFPPGITPDLLITCYLSRLFSHVNKALRKYFRDEPFKILWNIGAPMDHFEAENEALRSRYLTIVNAAWLSVFGERPVVITSKVSLCAAAEAVRPLMDAPVPPVHDRRFEILPETVAPIVSLSLEPNMKPGMYMMLDMGAGTTEFSVNLVTPRGADQAVVCYSDQTQLIGANDFERIERFGGPASDRFDGLLRRVVRHAKETCFNGYDKDRKSRQMREQWKDLTLLLSGGGARRQVIETRLLELLPVEHFPPGERAFSTEWHEPNIPVAGERRYESHRSSLLAVANGLSIDRQTWPVFFEPGDVEHHDGDEKASQPAGHWHVGNY